MGVPAVIELTHSTVRVPERLVVSRSGNRTPIGDTYLDLLLAIVAMRGRVLRWTDMSEVAWRGERIADGTARQRLLVLRRLVGRRGDTPRIRTVHGQGVRFVPDGDPPEPDGPDVILDLDGPALWLHMRSTGTSGRLLMQLDVPADVQAGRLRKKLKFPSSVPIAPSVILQVTYRFTLGSTELEDERTLDSQGVKPGVVLGLALHGEPIAMRSGVDVSGDSGFTIRGGDPNSVPRLEDVDQALAYVEREAAERAGFGAITDRDETQSSL